MWTFQSLLPERSIHSQVPRTDDGSQRVRVDYNYLNDWFFRQERVPCTYLDGYDYVYSTRDKVSRALDFIRENIAFDVIAIVNSPGAALKNLAVSNGMFTASGDKGAGVYMAAGLVEDCLITSCGNATDTTYGGGIYALGGRISRTTFTGCKVHMAWGYKGYGSALYLSNGAVCENSLFTGNAAPAYDTTGSYKYRGGVVHLTGAGTALVNCSVVRNRIARGGGNSDKNFAGIVQASGATVVNCVSYMNCPGDFDAATTVYGDVIGSAASFVHSAWGTAINGLSPDSPLAISDASFRNYAGGNFMPAAGSALAKGGTSWSDYLGSGALSETDLVGRARRIGRVLDIGCYKAPDTNLSIILR